MLLGAAGVLTVIIIRNRLADDLDRTKAMRAAVLVYKSAFASEIATVSNGSYAIDTFASAFQRHEAAVNTIRPLLTEGYQRKLQKAWNEYCGKGTDLGLDAEEYVQAFNASLYSTDKDIFGELKKRFAALHGCLDDLL